MGGGVGEVMSTDKILLGGGEDLDLKRRAILCMCTKHFGVWSNHARDIVGMWVRPVLSQIDYSDTRQCLVWFRSSPANAQQIVEVMFTLFRTLHKVLRPCHT